jgi:TPP-dependent pyruvate/acetoin dehydrogenase alpha subunit
MAFAEKYNGRTSVSVAFLGDGTLGEGVIYEAFNLASLWKAPILYVLENNRIAQTTPVELGVAGSIADRFHAFGIPTRELETSDVLEILPVAGELFEVVRREKSPQALILHTYRFGPHSKGDDTRDVKVIERMRAEHDPIRIHGERLEIDEKMVIEREIEDEIKSAFETAMQDPFPTNLD